LQIANWKSTTHAHLTSHGCTLHAAVLINAFDAAAHELVARPARYLPRVAHIQMRLVTSFAHLSIETTTRAPLPLLTAMTALHRLVSPALFHIPRKLALKARQIRTLLHKSSCAIQRQPCVIRHCLTLSTAWYHVVAGAAALLCHIVSRFTFARSRVLILKLVRLPISAKASTVFDSQILGGTLGAHIG
jgi:hypothetical protein